jgi:hypothetical protein
MVRRLSDTKQPSEADKSRYKKLETKRVRMTLNGRYRAGVENLIGQKKPLTVELLAEEVGIPYRRVKLFLQFNSDFADDLLPEGVKIQI